MTIRRVAVLISFVALFAFAAFGQISPFVLPSGPSCTPATGAPPCALPNVPYSVQLAVTGFPSGPSFTQTWALTGNVPTGLQINTSTGLISGTPIQTGTFNFQASVTYNGNPDPPTAQSYTLVIGNATLTMANPANVTGAVGQTVSMQFTATGGTTPYTYSLLTGTLPPGLTLNAATGLVSGTATTVGAYTFTIQVNDSASGFASATGNITINASPTTLTMANPTNVTGTNGTIVSMQFSASGGVTPYTYTLLSVSGTSEPGLTLNATTGLLSGTATAVGAYTPTVQVTDSTLPTHQTATATGTITINAPAGSLTMPNPTAITSAAGQTVTMQFTASGGTSPYTYAVVSGTLPPGLSLNTSTGAVTGTPTQAGAYTFSVQATDSANNQATAQGSITITMGLTASPTTVSGVVGQSMSPWIQFTAIGGTAPYTYTLLAGTLPGGLSLNASTGAITGQVTQQGTSAFLIQATDSTGLQATAQGNINITLLSLTGVSVTITPSGAVSAATQPAVTLTLGTAPVETITGTLTVGFSRSFDGGASREVVFSNGAPAIPFTVAAGSTTATFAGGSAALIVGTAAGFGTISVTFQDALGNTITPSGFQPVIFSIAGTTPVIKSFTLSCTGTTYSASVIAYSSTLDMTNAVFNITPTSGTNLAASSVTVALSPLFAAWFSSSQSNQYGGQFMLTVPFTFTISAGSTTNPIAAMTVTLTNSKGASAVSSPASPNPACQ